VRRFETTLYGALLRGQSKKRYLHAPESVPSNYNPEAPFGLESFDPELTTEGLMAERKRRGQVLKGYMSRKPCATRISASVVKALLIMVIMQRRFSF